MIKLDGTTFTVSDRGLPLLLRRIPSSFAQPGKTIKVVYIAHDLHNRLVAGLTSNDQTYEIEVARLLSHGVFSGIESSEVLTRAISKFQWQHPLLCLEVGIRVFFCARSTLRDSGGIPRPMGSLLMPSPTIPPD